MQKNWFFNLAASLILVFVVQAISAQNFKEVLGLPEKFDQPIDYSTTEDREEMMKRPGKKDREIAWLVINDRANNKTYIDPDENSSVKKVLDFADYFYVAEEKAEWLRIIKCRKPSELKIPKGSAVEDFGWVRKDKMLLWRSGLLHERTRINQKAFLLNKADDINHIINGNKDVADIYLTPNGTEKLEGKSIYEFYFIMKKEGNRYLLSKEVELNTLDLEKSNPLVGWVRSERAADWNTRIAMEPNYIKPAFEERKSKSDIFRLVGYKDAGGASLHAKSGAIKTDQIYWDKDPVITDASKMSEEDPFRYKGTVVRFPLLNATESFYRTGVIGEITIRPQGGVMEAFSKVDELDWSGIISEINKLEKAKDNFNVFFVIEGTKGMAPYKSSIIQTINKVNAALIDVPNVRWGASIYRDALEVEDEKIFSISPLNVSQAEMISFVENSTFDSWQDNDSWTSLYYGIQQSVLEGGFNENHTNIIFVIGNNGDYYSDRARREMAKADNHKTLRDKAALTDVLSRLNANIIAIQPNHNNDRESTAFGKTMSSIIVEHAKKQYQLYTRVNDYIPDLPLSNPYMPDLDESNDVSLEGGAIYGRIVIPNKGSMQTQEDVASVINGACKEIYLKTNAFYTTLSDLFDKGSALEMDGEEGGPNSGEITGPLARTLLKLLQKDEANMQDNLAKLVRQKYVLYTEVYMPKKITTARYTTTTYVMFMPERDLAEYINTLDELANALNETTDRQRQVLYETMVSLANKFSGNTQKSKIDRMLFSELQAYMQGLEAEWNIETISKDFALGDIFNPRKMSDAEIESFATRIVQKRNDLKKIQRLGSDYEFAYNTGENTYYWIPIEYTL